MFDLSMWHITELSLPPYAIGIVYLSVSNAETQSNFSVLTEAKPSWKEFLLRNSSSLDVVCADYSPFVPTPYQIHHLPLSVLHHAFRY